jgi:hypothetical protein
MRSLLSRIFGRSAESERIDRELAEIRAAIAAREVDRDTLSALLSAHRSGRWGTTRLDARRRRAVAALGIEALALLGRSGSTGSTSTSVVDGDCWYTDGHRLWCDPTSHPELWP